MERSGGQHNKHSCQLQRKKSVTKMEKPENVLKSKGKNGQTAFQITTVNACVACLALA